MPNRYKRTSTPLDPSKRTKLFYALRNTLSEGYSFADAQSDLLAGLVVAMVAVPLGMALAIASGVAPQYGLYTVILGGFVALLGGSRFQVTGPTAAFVVILFPVVQKFGFAGLLIAGLIAGILLIIMGLCRMGKFIQFIPYPVTTGFTSGIAVVIAILQIKDLFGLKIEKLPEHFFGKVSEIIYSFGTMSTNEFAVGLGTLIVLILWPKLNKKIPAPLVALSLASIAVVILKLVVPDFDVATIGSRFTFEINGLRGSGIPQALPVFEWPWNQAGSNGSFFLNLEIIEAIIPNAFAIAMLGAIESLLSAVVADGMARTKHDPDAELIALGIGNLICPFFGGIPATGAIARTATNIRFGAKSPLSAVFHSLFTLLVILIFAPYVAYLPMAALSGLLILVAYNMSEYKHFFHILKVAPKSDVIVLLTCFSLTVTFDMVIGVTVGTVLAALLFMQRMSEVTDGHKVAKDFRSFGINQEIPKDIVVYEIEGPLFFGAAEKAAETLTDITDNVRGVIFLMNNVPAMDVTGLVALEGAIKKITTGKRKISLVGLRTQPKELFTKSEVIKDKEHIVLSDSIDDAIAAINNS